jgi:hypothetical protein
MLCELPDGDEQAEEDRGVSDGFKGSSAPFFGPDQESVSRFLVIVHKSCLVNGRTLMQRSCHANLLSHNRLIDRQMQFLMFGGTPPNCSADGNFVFRFWDRKLPRQTQDHATLKLVSAGLGLTRNARGANGTISG